MRFLKMLCAVVRRYLKKVSQSELQTGGELPTSGRVVMHKLPSKPVSNVELRPEDALPPAQDRAVGSSTRKDERSSPRRRQSKAVIISGHHKGWLNCKFT